MLRTLLKREESYAIHALINIAENPGTHAHQIADDLDMPAAFMAKVLRKLVKTRFITSKMGRSGGVALLADPKDINLLNIIEAISGPLVLDSCQLQNQCATQKRKGHCKLNLVWHESSQEIRSSLERVTLEELCN